ncbi:MAG: 50S ribosomal protein L32 [Firmicutes bacterium]|nr:50S ribosomal protein L32 [Bacillota bacterium]
MAVPKTKVSKSRRDMRNAANFRASATTLTECPQCHKPVRPHCVCKECGYYKGTKRIEVASDKASAE